MLPDLSTAPLVTVAHEGSRRVLAAVDAAARRLGLKVGLAAAHAQAVVPGLAMVEADPDADRAALVALAGWCLRYSPVVQPDPPDGIFMDVEGSAHLFGGETALLEDAVARLRRAGFAAEAALADMPGCAWALARHRPGTIVATGCEAEALAPLPLGALRLPRDTVEALHILGIERVAHLAGFPRPHLALRFGSHVMAAYDRAHADAREPLTPLVPRTVPQVRLAFAEPLGHLDGLAAATARLMPRLCRDLARRKAGLRRLDIVFRRIDGHPIGIRIGTSVPSRDPLHLMRLVGERLSAIDPGFGIDEVSLHATRTERMADVQISAGAIADERLDTASLGPLVDRLGNRLGAERVFRVAPVESRVPERSVRRVAALAPPGGISWPAALPRPSRLIDPPEPVEAIAIVPDDPPASFVWRRVRYVVRNADGPERVRGEWWRADEETASLRDYYRVEDMRGGRFWLFRDAPMSEGGAWWLHGRFA